MTDPYHRGLCAQCQTHAVRYGRPDGSAWCWQCWSTVHGEEHVHDAISAAGKILYAQQYGCVGVEE